MNHTALLSKLEAKLIEAIPTTIRAAGKSIPQPVSLLRLYYFDGHAPCFYIQARTISKKLRKSLLDEDGQETLWSASDDTGDGDILVPSDPEEESGDVPNDQDLVDLCNQVYEHISDDIMPQVQKMLHRVCRTLNGLDWTPFCKVTPDFVVAAADGSRCFGGDDDDTDIRESIPQEKLDALRKKQIYIDPDGDSEIRPQDTMGYVLVAAARDAQAIADAEHPLEGREGFAMDRISFTDVCCLLSAAASGDRRKKFDAYDEATKRKLAKPDRGGVSIIFPLSHAEELAAIGDFEEERLDSICREFGKSDDYSKWDLPESPRAVLERIVAVARTACSKKKCIIVNYGRHKCS